MERATRKCYASRDPTSMAPFKKHYTALVVINIFAMATALYLTWAHFKPSLTEFCVFGEWWNCDIVNKSIYSEILNIPVAILGLVAYTAFLIFSIRGLFRDQRKLIPYFLFVVTGGTLFALYLTGIETFVLRTYCLFCVIQQILILIELNIVVNLYKHTKKHS